MLKLAAPWTIFYRKIEELFREDPEVTFTFNEDEKKVTLFVHDPYKAGAIEKLLPKEKQFGNVTLTIDVVTRVAEGSLTDLIKIAFEGNDALNRIIHADTPLTGDIDYVMFRKEVIQFYSDDLGTPTGVCSTLYQDIAKEVLPEAVNVHYCTDTD